MVKIGILFTSAAAATVISATRAIGKGIKDNYFYSTEIVFRENKNIIRREKKLTFNKFFL
jgi:hypothetical protein